LSLIDSSLFIGIVTRQHLDKLLREGDITLLQLKKFYSAAWNFYIAAANYALYNLPLEDELLANAEFVYFPRRAEATISQVTYFISRLGNSVCINFMYCTYFSYSKVLKYSSAEDLNSIEEEFIQYQMLEDNEIPQKVWDAALVVEDKDEDIRKYRMDIIWSYLSGARTMDGKFLFKKLAKIALLVLTLPHSNAQEERVFSMVTKNKTKFRPSLGLDGTLSSILTIKLANEKPCFAFEPPQEVLDTAKKATVEYNKAHSSKR